MDSVPAIGIGLVVTLAAVAIAGFGGSSIVAVLMDVSLLSVGAQSVLVLLQTMMVSIDPAARSRFNTAHIVRNFIGDALGSTLAAALWQVGQWRAIMVCSHSSSSSRLPYGSFKESAVSRQRPPPTASDEPRPRSRRITKAGTAGASFRLSHVLPKGRGVVSALPLEEHCDSCQVFPGTVRAAGLTAPASLNAGLGTGTGFLTPYEPGAETYRV